MKLKFIRTAIFLHVAAGIALILAKREWLPDFYNPDYMAAIAFFGAFLIVLPQLIFSSNDKTKQNAVSDLQAIIAVSLLIGGAGGLWLYQFHRYGFEFDKLAHFIIPFLFTKSAADFLAAWYGVKKKRAVILSAAIIFVGGFLWEFYELFSDLSFGTQMLGLYGEEIPYDTRMDLIMNTLGILVGALSHYPFLQKKSKVQSIEP